MRIIRYSKRVHMYPWASFELVPEREVKESELLGGDTFDTVVRAVKANGFDYVIVNQPDEVLIERGDGHQQPRDKP